MFVNLINVTRTCSCPVTSTFHKINLNRPIFDKNGVFNTQLVDELTNGGLGRVRTRKCDLETFDDFRKISKNSKFLFWFDSLELGSISSELKKPRN